MTQRPGRIVLLILAFALAPQQLFGSDTIFTHQDAGDSGAFHFGPAEASLSTQADAVTQKQLFELDYSVGKDGGAGIWTKDYPDELSRDCVDVIRIGVRLAAASQAGEITLKAEVKGNREVQVIQLQPNDGWTETVVPLQWDRIGDLNEVVLVVTRVGGAGNATGSLQANVGFEKLSFWDKQSASVVGRVIAAFLLAALLGVVVAVLRAGLGEQADTAVVEPTAALRRDFTLALATVLVVGIALAIFSLGDPSFGGGWNCLVIGLLGGVAGEVLKFGFTGRHLRPLEVCQNVFVTGALAATANSMALLEVPTAGVEIVKLCSFTSATFAVLFHFSNAYALAAGGRHLSAVTSGIILSAPFVFSGLLLVGSGKLDLLGSVLVVFVFNEAIANGISLATHRRFVSGFKVHLWFLGVATRVGNDGI